MKNYTIVKQESDAEIYKINGQYIKVVWGYSTGSDTGPHNEFGTDACVFKWIGKKSDVNELPGAMDEDWLAIEGFDIEVDADEWIDWEDYSNKVNEILAEIEGGN